MSRLTREQFKELSEESKYTQYVNQEYRGDTYKRIAVQLNLWKDGSTGHNEALEDLHNNDRVDSERSWVKDANKLRGYNYSSAIFDDVGVEDS